MRYLCLATYHKCKSESRERVSLKCVKGLINYSTINDNRRSIIIIITMNSLAIIFATLFCVAVFSVDPASAARRNMPSLLEEDGVRKTNRSAGKFYSIKLDL